MTNGSFLKFKVQTETAHFNLTKRNKKILFEQWLLVRQIEQVIRCHTIYIFYRNETVQYNFPPVIREMAKNEKLNIIKVSS